MDLTYERLTPGQIESEMGTVPGWVVQGGALSRTYQFGSYSEGVLFACAVAGVAERLNHHPVILIDYRSVTVSMVSHDADNKLTAFDFELARRISAIP